MKLWRLVTFFFGLIISGNVNAALLERLDGLAYYDTEADLTWLADANYAQTSGFDSDGRMNWATADAWAANLEIGGVIGWRLPDTLEFDATCDNLPIGYNCTGSEMGNMYYNVLGGNASSLLSSIHNTNYELFSNIQSRFMYWSATEFSPNPTVAWGFVFKDGQQGYSYIGNSSYAWAVHSGDVSPVPVPAAVWLFSSGLVSLIGFARRRKA